MTTAAALVCRVRSARVRRSYRRRSSPAWPCAGALHGACRCAPHGLKPFHSAQRNLSSDAATRRCVSCPELFKVDEEQSKTDITEVKGNIFEFLKTLASQAVTVVRPTDLFGNADQKATVEKSSSAEELLKQLATTAASVCNTGCPCPFPCGPFGNKGGCNCLPPPCNCPPKCIQYMTGYYYYPYGIWFCGPYHVTGLCCPVACPGGCGAPCCPPCTPPCPGPCSCCVVPAVATTEAGQDALHNDAIRSTLDEVAAASESQQRSQDIIQSYPSMPMMPNMVPNAPMPQNMPFPPNMPMPNMPMPQNMPMPNMPFPNMPMPNMPNMPGMVPNIVPNMPMPNMPMPGMPMPNMPMPGGMPMPNMPMPNMPMPGAYPGMPMPNMPMPGMPMQSMQMHSMPVQDAQCKDEARDAVPQMDISKEKVIDFTQTSATDTTQGTSENETDIYPVLRTAVYPSDVEAGSLSGRRRSLSPSARPSRPDLPKYFDSDSLTSGLQLQENRFMDHNYPGNRMLHSLPKNLDDLEPERFPTIQERMCPVFLSEDDFDLASVPKFRNPYPVHKPLSDHLKSYC